MGQNDWWLHPIPKLSDLLAGNQEQLDAAFNNAFYGKVKCSPSMAAGVTVTADAAAWTLGIPSNPILESAAPITITGISFENLSAAVTYELVLYAGEVEIARVRVSGTAAQFVPLNTPILDAASVITAQVASSSTNADTVSVSVRYVDVNGS